MNPWIRIQTSPKPWPCWLKAWFPLAGAAIPCNRRRPWRSVCAEARALVRLANGTWACRWTVCCMMDPGCLAELAASGKTLHLQDGASQRDAPNARACGRRGLRRRRRTARRGFFTMRAASSSPAPEVWSGIGVVTRQGRRRIGKPRWARQMRGLWKCDDRGWQRRPAHASGLTAQKSTQRQTQWTPANTSRTLRSHRHRRTAQTRLASKWATLEGTRKLATRTKRKERPVDLARGRSASTCRRTTIPSGAASGQRRMIRAVSLQL